jgi:hypothetical protein
LIVTLESASHLTEEEAVIDSEWTELSLALEEPMKVENEAPKTVKE